MNKYSYKGPVMEFEQCVSNSWEGTTYATSEKKPGVIWLINIRDNLIK